MTSTGKRPDWDLVFVLPNLKLGGDQMSPDELTLGLDGIAIVNAEDARVEAIRAWSQAADRFLGAFHNGNGVPITPSVLVVHRDLMASFGGNPEPIISFRNAVAMTFVLLNRARVRGGGWIGVSWSDTFDYHPAQLRTDGRGFDLWTPALNSIGFQLKDLAIAPAPDLYRNNIGPMDDHLGARLGRAWRLRYESRRQLRATGRVFRSLEAAYEAASISFRNYSSLQEVGMDAVDWATAVEVLAAPDGKKAVSKWDCIGLIGEFNWGLRPQLQHRRYRKRRRKASGGQPARFASINLAQKIYLHLHTARSKFVHGDTISPRLLLPFGDDAPSVLSLASTVYRTALVSYLERHWPWPVDVKDLKSLDLVPGWSFKQHLLAVVGEDDP